MSLRGYYDFMNYDSNLQELALDGWMLDDRDDFDALLLFVNGQHVGQVDRIASPGVGEFLPRIPHAKRSGFTYRGKYPAEQLEGMVDVALVGVLPDGAERRLETWFETSAVNRLPVAPPSLMQRTVHNQNPNHNLCIAMQSYREFWSRVQKYANGKIHRMLDWGSGCGRLAGPFLEYSGVREYDGCDIDSEGVTWCQENYPRGRFLTIAPYPPTPYESGSFPLIISYSVFTHLTQDIQNAWLEEMSRLLEPGGLFLATVHGDFAAQQASFPNDVAESFARDGFFDGLHDDTLQGVAPAGYYRATYQTREYTESHWSKVLDIVAYDERGALNFQDMVVMRKPTA